MATVQQENCSAKIFFENSQREVRRFYHWMNSSQKPIRKIYRVDPEYCPNINVNHDVSHEEMFYVCNNLKGHKGSSYTVFDSFFKLNDYVRYVCQDKKIPFITAKSLIEAASDLSGLMKYGEIYQYFQPITRLNMLYYEPQFVIERNKELFSKHYYNDELIFLDISARGCSQCFVPLGLSISCWASVNDKKYAFFDKFSMCLIHRNSKEWDVPCNYISLNDYEMLCHYYPEYMKQFVERGRQELTAYYDKEVLDQIDFSELANLQNSCDEKVDSLSLEDEEEVVEIWVGSKIEVVDFFSQRHEKCFVFVEPQYRIQIV